ncbi:hypothetical protein [Rhodoblastus sp.]|jgi:hypothetical protein|uniref:hypothetical protein n=1 Tax=Rhodoblastus sp. TaxID=1962975 RepID=UPI0025E9FBC4|nr:hypothetical protein [Rhodoblastus sp.]
MPTWYDAFGAEYNASNSNYTDQSQSNPTAVVGGSVHSVDVHNDQSNATFQQAHAGSGGYEAPSFGSDATNYNETHQYQNNPTAVIGDHIGSVDVHNNQSNYTEQQADAHSGGYEAPWSGSYAANSNATQQSQYNPTVVMGDHIGSVNVDNNQSNETHQQADAHSGGYEAPWFGSSAANSNETYQSQNDPTLVFGGSGGSVGHVDVHNNQSNETYQQADAHSGGYEAPWFGSSAMNSNETHQYQNNPTLVFGGSGGSIGSVDVHNNQSNETFQQADAHSGGHDLLGFPSSGGASNFNFTTQIQADPTIVIGDHIGSVDVHNSQSNATEQLALAHH